MAPPRAPEANLLYEDGRLVGVLICRAEGSVAQEMAIRALEIDAGWQHDAAVECVASARIQPGRWFKTPDRSGDEYQRGRWVAVKTDAQARAGATPAVHYSWAQTSTSTSWE